METTLVVMAAGIGSRFGGGIKQLEPVGPNGEIIMDYAIHDAIEAGFDKVVFIIRKDLEKDFREIIGNRMEKKIPVAYAFQEIDVLPEGYEVPQGRKKPWGTGQAVLACKGIVDTPFAVINADDYYGKEAFVKVHDFLVNTDSKEKGKLNFCMAGFILGNTLSDNGTVTRGICNVGNDGMLLNVEETSDIERVSADKVVCIRDGKQIEVDAESYVSMNMWGLTPDFFDELEKRFIQFLDQVKPEEALKKEYLLPMIIKDLLLENKAEVNVLETKDRWFGVTYKEDKQTVVDSFNKLHADGVYPSSLN